MIRVHFQGQEIEVQSNSIVRDLLPDPTDKTVVAARVNNAVRELDCQLQDGNNVKLIDTKDDDGMRIYRTSLVFLFVMAAKEVLKGCRVHFKHSLSNGLYGEIEYERPVVEKDIDNIQLRMTQLIEADLLFQRRNIPVSEASLLFAREGLHDKVRLLAQTKREMVTVYTCGWYSDYLSNVCVPSTGYLKYFKLKFYLPGFILECPTKENPQVVPDYVEQGKLANVYFEAEKWHNILQVTVAADLNDIVAEAKMGDLIRISEARHEKEIAAIADRIAKDRDRLRVILIAGPSSSGKTTFAQRLSVQLRVNGLRPVAIGLDDYFVDRDHTPRDEDGNFDFEALEAIDTKLFNEHLSKLIQGEPVELPSFNFMEGQREWRGNVLKVSPDQPIIIEGIHGLNDKLTASIPKGRKFKIYISALTNLNIDEHTRIPTTDVRVLRRMIRDSQFRSAHAVDTINRWPSVRRGEERHIFPYQEDADVMFNSALVYELALLKKYAEPLLREIRDDQREYSETRRLLRFLSHFYPIDSETDIPCNSIIREFVGGSCFHH